MTHLFRNLTKIEKIIVTFLSLVAVVSIYKIGVAFYDQHSDADPREGGIYVEGAVGKLEPLNPLYVHLGSVTYDITRLVFSGLTKYDPKTHSVVPDLADFTKSADGRTYTFVLKEGALWHDGTPVASDDVLFTFSGVIQNPLFKGLVLTYNDYSGIRVVKKDERTVQFILEKPDSFFLTKTMVGLLPKHLLSDVPIDTLEQHFFNQFPVGTGPYKLSAITPGDPYIEVSLERFENYYGAKPHIPTILMRLFSNFDSLISRSGELDAIRNVPDSYADKILKKPKFALERYVLPQYVAVFFNMDSLKLKEAKVRLALQLGTNKDDLLKMIGQSERIDTPLLEIDQANWMYQYSVKKANGALYETAWQLPKIEEASPESALAPAETPKDLPLEEKVATGDTSDVTFISSPNGGKDYKTYENKITLTGSVPKKTKSIRINDYELKKYVPGDPGFSYVTSFEFGNLKKGSNIYKVYATDFNGKESLIDAITITSGDSVTFSEADKKALEEENEKADALPTRQNKNGDLLSLHLITASKPEVYGQIAQSLKEEWKKIGVDLEIEILDMAAFQEKMGKREYDLLIFGQNLGYNLDAFPYWHSSQAKIGGFNLSNFKNFIVDSLLEKARFESEESSRKKTLQNIQSIIAQEVPAIFLYSPTYQFAISRHIAYPGLKNLATTSDHLAAIEDWYANTDRRFKEGTTPLTFLIWLIKQF